MYSCCGLVAKFCLTLCDPVDCSTPGLPVLHYVLNFAQVHVHWVSDVIQPSHPLFPSSPSAFNLSQLQGVFSQWANCISVAKVYMCVCVCVCVCVFFQNVISLESRSISLFRLASFIQWYAFTVSSLHGLITHFFLVLNNILLFGLPRWHNDKESAGRSRRCKRSGVQSLGWEDPLEQEMAPHSSIHAWKLP